MTVVTEQQHASSPQPLLLALQRTQERNRELENYIKWEDRLFSNPHLSATHKLALIATRRAVLRGRTHDETGRTRINLNTIAEQIGVSSDTVGRNLKYLATVGVIDRQTVPEIQENGERWTRVYASFNNELLQTPEKIVPETPRNHGGNRYRCQYCGSEQVTIKRRVTLICKCCQHESLLEESERDQEPTSDQQHASEGTTVRADDLQDNRKPVSPPMGGDSSDGTGNDLRDSHQREDDQDDLYAAAALLFAMAGQGNEYIEMSRRGAKKYYTVDRPITLEDTLDHLRGGKARGALCSYLDKQTRALCWDTDEMGHWKLLEEAAQQLVEAGYAPILEPSPVEQRGGHLWVIFSDLVSVSAARGHILSLAPHLADIQEYWPGPADVKRWNKVRLPGGKYVRPGISTWCQLISVGDGECSQDGQSAATLLLSHQTPAHIVPIPSESLPGVDLVQDSTDAVKRGDDLTSNDDQGRKVPGDHTQPGPDQQWEEKYGQTDEGKRLWFAFTPTYVATWYNAHNDVEQLLAPDRDGYGLARTPSVAIRSDHWTDFGVSARRSDGTQDSGDSLELQVRMSQAPKPEVLRQAAKDLVRQARTELEQAARNGEPIPAWIEEIITDAGRAHYERVCTGRQGIATANTMGGLTGFSTVRNTASVASAHADNEGRQLRDSAQAAPSFQPLSTEIQTLLHERNLTHGKPCPGCACELYRDLYGEPACCRCYPPKGYHQYSDQVDVIYPRKKKRVGM